METTFPFGRWTRGAGGEVRPSDTKRVTCSKSQADFPWFLTSFYYEHLWNMRNIGGSCNFLLAVWCNTYDDNLAYHRICMDMSLISYDLVGGFNPSQKYEGQLGRLFPTDWKNDSHVPVTTNQWFGRISTVGIPFGVAGYERNMFNHPGIDSGDELHLTDGMEYHVKSRVYSIYIYIH